MRSGALRDQLTIQRRVQVGVSALNAPNFEWQDFVTPFCEIAVKRGREHFDVGTKQRYGEDVWIFRVRYDDVAGADESMRISFDSSLFDIRSIRPDRQYRRDVLIECVAQDFVLQAAALAIAIETTIPDGANGIAYGGFTVSASGGTSPYVFSVASGTLPTGLSLNASTGAVTGTPTVVDDFDFVLRVTDAAHARADLPSITITVSA